MRRLHSLFIHRHSDSTPAAVDGPIKESSAQKECRQEQGQAQPTQEPTGVASGMDQSTDEQEQPQKLQEENYVEAYVELANRIVFTMDPSTRRILQDLDLPGHAISGLGFLKAKQLRRPTIIEQWSPYEIAMFQAAVAHCGKRFELVQKEIATKTVQQVVDFYYIWKKTSHYQQWKNEYVPPHLDTESDDEK